MKPQITDLLHQIDAHQAQIRAHQPWDAATRRKVEHKLRLDWNYHSQSIEGGTLTARETRTIMLGSVEVQGKPLKDVLEMQRHDELIQDIMQMGKGEKRLSESRIKAIHAAIMYEADPAKRALIGQWKTEANEIINFQGEKFAFTAPTEVPAAIHDLLNRTNANWDKLERGAKDARHPVLMAFDFHLEYLSIHPFYDGNGRTARILLNLILIAFGYPPVIVKTSDKDQYGKLLAEIQGYGAKRDLYYAFMAGLLLRSQELILSALRGEEIEEEDDLMKEIALFKKQQEAKVKGLTPVRYDRKVFQSIWQTIILPLYEEVRNRTQRLDEFFGERIDRIRTDVATREHGVAKNIRSIDRNLSAGQPIEELFRDIAPEPGQLDYDITWKTYQFNPKAPFHLSLKLHARFDDYTFQIYAHVENWEKLAMQPAYAELPHLTFDPHAFAQETLRALFDALKTKAAHD